MFVNREINVIISFDKTTKVNNNISIMYDVKIKIFLLNNHIND
jgi:hypothetical protein